MFDKIKEKLMPWISGVVCAVVAGAVAMMVFSYCGNKTDTAPTVRFPDIKVYIKGEVKNPGLYETGADTRLIELIEIAGGPTENADMDSLNLAAILADGTTVRIPAKGSEEVGSPTIEMTDQSIYSVDTQPESVGSQDTSATPSADKINSGTININTASAAELMRLPGVGEATANKIISYRETNGKFLAIEEIMNVSGIGEKKFEAMKQFITVE